MWRRCRIWKSLLRGDRLKTFQFVEELELADTMGEERSIQAKLPFLRLPGVPERRLLLSR